MSALPDHLTRAIQHLAMACQQKTPQELLRAWQEDRADLVCDSLSESAAPGGYINIEATILSPLEGETGFWVELWADDGVQQASASLDMGSDGKCALGPIREFRNGVPVEGTR